MINWSSLTEAQILLFALILMRMIAFVTSSAIFGATSISVQVKVLLSIVLSIMMFPIVRTGTVNYDLISHDIIFLVVRELVIGLSLGFITRLFFFSLAMTGDLVSVSIGLSSSQLFNPMTGSQGSTIEQYYMTLGSLIFLAIDGHHLLIGAIAQSYFLLPVNEMNLNTGVFSEMAVFGQEVMVMAIKMCAPVLVTILIVNLAMGILGRAVPQINVLVTSMPVTIMIGMAIVFVSLPLLVVELHGVIEITTTKLFHVMKSL